MRMICRTRSKVDRFTAASGSLFLALFVIFIAKWLFVALCVLLVVATVWFAVKAAVGPIDQPPRPAQPAPRPRIVLDDAARAHRARMASLGHPYDPR